MPRTRYLWHSLTIAIVGLFIGSAAVAQDPTRPPRGAGEAAEELVRGPVHEAFGQPTVFDPQAGPVVPKAPPEPIEELPPDQKPEGENVTWIPGYWHWDAVEKTHIWVSGFWRSVPPERTWVPGYWTQATEGHQWVSGYWMSAQATEVEYLPPPPENLESGPNTEATAEGQIWIPGCWIWQTTRYVWRPGFWVAGHADWIWVPAHYVWTPSGYVFVDGFWDYPLFNRGLLFAPVTFTAYRPGFVYTPSVVIDIRFLVVSLFVRPHFHHYYFGDYYAADFGSAGIYPWYAFHMSRFGYDPLYAHTRYVYSRRDVRWEEQIREQYVVRRENAAARPPRTFRAFTEWARKAPDSSIALARPLSEVAGARDFPVRVERVDERRLEVIKNQSKQIREFRQARVKAEQEAAREVQGKGARKAPARVKMPESPKLAPGAGAKGKAVAPPTAPRTPELTPGTPAPDAKSKKARTLPDPEDVIRKGKDRVTPKGKDIDPPTKKKDPPVTVPPKKDKDRDPPVTVPPKKDRDPILPPKKDKDRDPPVTVPPKKDKDRDPPVTVPPKKDKDRDPPVTVPPKKDKDRDPPPKKAPPKKDKDDKDKDKKDKD